MNYNFSDGERLVIKLFDGHILEADCIKCIQTTNPRITVVNLIDTLQNVEVHGTLSFYQREIESVHLLNEETTPNVLNIGLTRNEFERLRLTTFNYIYMATIDNRYKKAVNHLLNCEIVGVVGIGSETGRRKRISLLVLSSPDQVYIFDLVSFHIKEFPSELKRILELNCIKKVVHDSRNLVDCLYHVHKVQMRNIFDTQVADIMVQKSRTNSIPETVRNFSDCLVDYLNFPRGLTETPTRISSEYLEEWFRRPLDNDHKVKAARQVTYYITLKGKLEKLMLKNFYAAVEERCEVSQNPSCFNNK